jgi:hypothetical protein
MSKHTLQPWALGPFELIRHANEHLQAGGDTDRRIAIIGFDNAIEVCIDVFMKLHPKLRDGVELTKEEVEKASRNYHTKIEFLDRYTASQRLSFEIPIETIVWYHQLRNELYHSGNGMVPEIHVLEGARSAAITVFNALFKTDISSMLGEKPIKLSQTVKEVPFSQNDEMEFLRLFIELERTVEHTLQRSTPGRKYPRLSFLEMWENYRNLVKTPKEWDSMVNNIAQIRNQIAHGTPVDNDRVSEAYFDLWKILEDIKLLPDEITKYVHSSKADNHTRKL